MLIGAWLIYVVSAWSRLCYIIFFGVARMYYMVNTSYLLTPLHCTMLTGVPHTYMINTSYLWTILHCCTVLTGARSMRILDKYISHLGYILLCAAHIHHNHFFWPSLILELVFWHSTPHKIFTARIVMLSNGHFLSAWLWWAKIYLKLVNWGCKYVCANSKKPVVLQRHLQMWLEILGRYLRVHG